MRIANHGLGLVCVAFFAHGCSGHTMTAHGRGEPLDPKTCVASSGGNIACSGRNVAAVVCVPQQGRTCRALAVHFLDDDETAWIYRPPGFDPAHPEQFRRHEIADVEFADDVVLAANGSSIWFTTRTRWTTKHWQQFDLAAGNLHTVDRCDVWKVWALLQEKRAFILGGEKSEQEGPIIW